MDTQEIINLLGTSKKKTPVKVYISEKKPIDYGTATVFGAGDKVVFGEWNDLKPILEANAKNIDHYIVENSSRNQALPLLDTKNLNARIEPGAVIRDHVQIGERAVVMMGAVLNVGSVVGAGSMVDMGAILGGRATVGDNCHIGAGAVLAGVVEPASAQPVVIGNGVMVGANAVVLEGVQVGAGAVVAAGAVVIADVPENAVVAGTPARVIKMRDASTDAKTALEDALRNLD